MIASSAQGTDQVDSSSKWCAVLCVCVIGSPGSDRTVWFNGWWSMRAPTGNTTTEACGSNHATLYSGNDAAGSGTCFSADASSSSRQGSDGNDASGNSSMDVAEADANNTYEKAAALGNQNNGSALQDADAENATLNKNKTTPFLYTYHRATGLGRSGLFYRFACQACHSLLSKRCLPSLCKKTPYTCIRM